VLLAEELALVAINPESGRHALGTRSQLNACIAGLLVGELVLDGVAACGVDSGVVVPEAHPAPASPVLAAAAEVVADKGPKMKAVLSDMDRGLTRLTGRGSWDSVLDGLVAAGVLTTGDGGARSKNELLDPAQRDAIVARLRAAAAGDDALDPRTALVLSMTGPAQLLQVVAPHHGERRHCRRRIDHALDGTPYEAICTAVHKLIEEEAAAAAAAAVVATTA
jgi:hypothetical protein